MLDTVRFEVFAPLRAGMADRLWQWRPQIRLKPGPLGKHLQYIECCSLPRLLWEHNGRLISNQAELDEALTKLWQEANTVAEMPLISTWKPMRLDLVWQFEGLLAGRVIDALSAFRFPGVRKPPLHQAEHGVSWRGAGSRFVVTAYDKTRKMLIQGDVLRIEVRLCGNEIRRLRGRDWQSFDGLWAAYREIVLQLPNVPVANQSAGWPEAVGQFVPAEYHEIVLTALKQKSNRTRRENRRRMRISAAAIRHQLCWANLLPVNNPPPPVAVEPKRRRSQRP